MFKNQHSEINNLVGVCFQEEKSVWKNQRLNRLQEIVKFKTKEQSTNC